MSVRVKSICDVIITYLESKGIEAVYSLTPDYDLELKGAQWFITPLASEIEWATRDGCSYNITVQILACKYIDSYEDESIQSTIDFVEDLKEEMLNATIETDSTKWHVERLASSGTQFLSSSQLTGGLIDSAELEESFILQIPIILSIRRN